MRHAAIDFVVRTVRRRDLHRCAVLDRLTHSEPWTYHDYAASNRDNDTIVLVAVLPAQYEFGEELIGVAVAESEGKTLKFHRLVVHPEWQRCGVGSAMFSLALRTVPADTVEALVPRDSEPHVCFWAGIGFTKDGKRECAPALDVYKR